MAFGFIKKIFSFDDKKVEDTQTPEEAQEVAAPVAEPIQEAVPAPIEAPEVPETAPLEPKEQKPVQDEPAEVTSEAEEPVTESTAPEITQEEVPAATIEQPIVKPQAPKEPQASPKPPVRDETRGSITLGDAPEPQPETPNEADTKQKSWLGRLTTGLSRSSKQLTDNISSIFTKRKLDEDTLQDLEDVLIQSDLGIQTALRITDSLSSSRYGKDISTEEVRQVMAEEITKVLGPVAQPLALDLSHKPHVILVVGVNGTGKTTTIGKLAAKLTSAGLKVTLGAGDTFRAAAIEQLKIWATRTDSEFVATKLGADAAGLAFSAYETARGNGSDVVIIDTAGRLQNKTELMDELAKVVRVLQKHDPEAPHTVLQTLDATTGQNALNQVEIFRNIAGVNGLVMTKLDGTARGGILVAIAAKFKLPVYFIGVGEEIDDLEPFRADDFAAAIVGSANMQEGAAQ